jgi:hypothetical protein
MTGTLSHDPAAFRAAAGDFLTARPDRNTVLLSVTDMLLALGRDLYGAAEPSFGWWRADGDPAGEVTGAWLWTPPHAVSVSAMPPEAAAALPALLAGLDPRPGRVRGEERLAARVAAALAEQGGGGEPVRLLGERLYRLGELRPPRPAPPGRARSATPGDRDLLRGWLRRFHADIGHDPSAANERQLDARIAEGRMVLWEADGQPVSMAGLTAGPAGVARVGPVYTPAALRGRGYAGAAVAAAARGVAAAGPRGLVLFADRANPTSTALYERLGFVPVEDCAVFACDGTG